MPVQPCLHNEQAIATKGHVVTEQVVLDPEAKSAVPRPVRGLGSQQPKPLSVPLPHMSIIAPVTTVRSDECAQQPGVRKPLPNVDFRSVVLGTALR
jgi:hypothetical protein